MFSGCLEVFKNLLIKIKSKPLLNIPPSNHLHLNLYPSPDLRTARAMCVSLAPGGSDPVGLHNAEKPRQGTPHWAHLHGSVPLRI